MSPTAMEQMRKQREADEERRMALEYLLQSDGWKVFVKAMQQLEAAHYTSMVSTQEPHPAAKSIGAYHAIKHALAWPRQEVEALTKKLETLGPQLRR